MNRSRGRRSHLWWLAESLTLDLPPRLSHSQLSTARITQEELKPKVCPQAQWPDRPFLDNGVDFFSCSSSKLVAALSVDCPRLLLRPDSLLKLLLLTPGRAPGIGQNASWVESVRTDGKVRLRKESLKKASVRQPIQATRICWTYPKLSARRLGLGLVRTAYHGRPLGKSGPSDVECDAHVISNTGAFNLEHGIETRSILSMKEMPTTSKTRRMAAVSLGSGRPKAVVARAQTRSELRESSRDARASSSSLLGSGRRMGTCSSMSSLLSPLLWLSGRVTALCELGN